jgi:PAS domain S-box-containing protein
MRPQRSRWRPALRRPAPLLQMTAHLSLHCLALASGSRTRERLSAAVNFVFPNSHLEFCASPKAALAALDETVFDLVILVAGSTSDARQRLFDRLMTHPTPMPVVLLVRAASQDELHAVTPPIDPDWAVAVLDRLTTAGLAATVRQAIGRHELKWERAHLQRAFESSMLQYRNLFDEVPDVIFLCDRTGCLLDVNHTATRVFGRPKERMILSSIFEAFGIDEAAFNRLVERAIESEGPIEDLEVEFRPGGERTIHGLMHVIARRMAPSGPLQFQGVIKDITTRMGLERRLRRSETRYKTFFELARQCSGSLELAEIARRAIELIAPSCGAASALLLVNRRGDELRPIAVHGLSPAQSRAIERARPPAVGQGSIGRWAIGSRLQTSDVAQFDRLEKPIADWLDSVGADRVVGCPLGQGNPTAPASILLLAYSESPEEAIDEELLLGLARTLEIGVNNCLLYENAREAETKYRELWEHAPAIFMSFLKGGVVFEANRTAARALGRRRREIIGRSFNDWVHPDDRDRFAENHKRVVERGDRIVDEIRLSRADGGALVVSMRSEPLANGEGIVIGERSVLHDITRDKELEAQMRDHSQNLERMVDERTLELKTTTDFLNGVLEGAVEYAIFALDERGAFVHFNRGAQLLAHVEAEEVVGKEGLGRLLEGGEAAAGELLAEADARGAFTGEAVVRTGDGRSIAAQFTINRLRGANPGNLAYVGIARDVTEQKRLEALARRYNEQLEQIIEEKTRELDLKHVQLIQSSKLATLGEMATGIAHELNQPLSGIRTRAQLLTRQLRQGPLEPDQVSAKQEEVIALVDRISRIIEHMRIFARQDEQPFAPFDVRESIDGCLDLIGEQLRLHSIDVELDVPASLPRILGEPSQIEQVLLNLIANARDALDEKEVRLRREADGRTPTFRKRLQLRVETGGELRLKLSDNGSGISPAARKRIFQPFFTTKPVGKGTGLGLSISYGIITNHKGRIDFENRVGGGTTFTIALPIHHEESESSAEIEPTPIRAAAGGE